MRKARVAIARRFDLPTNLALIGTASATAAGWMVQPAIGLAVLAVLSLGGASRAASVRSARRGES